MNDAIDHGQLRAVGARSKWKSQQKARRLGGVQYRASTFGYGGLSAEDYAVLRAIREAIPDANNQSTAGCAGVRQ